MRIIYFSDNQSEHNRRFLTKLADAGHEIWFCDISENGATSAAVAALPGANLLGNSLRNNLGPSAAEAAVQNGALSAVRKRCATPVRRETWGSKGVRRLRLSPALPPNPEPEMVRRLLPELRAALAELGPDLVHAGPVQSAGYLAALSGFHPLLVMSWGSDILLHAERDASWERATRITLQAADAFFCDCAAVRERALRFASFDDSQIVQFPWGIRRGMFSPRGRRAGHRFSSQPGRFIFICTRAWEPLYGIEILLQAFAAAYLQNGSLRLLLVGSGSKADWMRRFVAENGLADGVEMVGAIAHNQLPTWFRSADAYISCALSDGTSISLLEAMATGLPVVATDIASNREWIVEEENGWLAPAVSVQAFAGRMLRVAALTPSERRQISERNQSIVGQRADWDTNFLRLLQMYERLKTTVTPVTDNFVAAEAR